MSRKIGTIVGIFLVCVWALSGCNTVKGVGKDVQGTGRAIEKTAE